MSDDIHDIAEWYDSDPEREHARLTRHQLEYDLTWHYLARYLPTRGRILEVGAGTGRYTLELARRGFLVTAVDISAEQLEFCRQRIHNMGLDRNVKILTADIRNLGDEAGDEYDAALVMGPLYHLVEREDREKALEEVHNRLRKGGIIISAFISRFGIMGELIRNKPEWIEDQAEVRSILELGRDPDHLRGEGFRGYFATTAEIVPLHEEAGFETIALAGIEPGISAYDESYNVLAGKQRQMWLDLLFEISTEPSILGASRHLLYIGRNISFSHL